MTIMTKDGVNEGTTQDDSLCTGLDYILYLQLLRRYYDIGKAGRPLVGIFVEIG